MTHLGIPSPTLIRGLATLVPPTVLEQEVVADVFGKQPGLSRLGQRLVATAFGASGIERRYTVLDELAADGPGTGRPPDFYDRESGELLLPGTRLRNEIYEQQAGPLFVGAAREALNRTPGIDAADVTHIITVSCTGFYAPGPDFVVARDLGLPPGVQRFHLGFMGCYAALPALRLAAQLCEADDAAVVLVVSVELCTLHLRTSNDPDTIVATSLFGDGAAAAVVTRRPAAAGERCVSLESSSTRTTPVGEEAMAWRIGDHGFEMVLSTVVPHVIGEHVDGALEPLFDHDSELRDALAARTISDEIPHWAVHPGGRSILDHVEEALELTSEQLQPARETLRDFGNMSSATVMFVLRHILDSEPSDGDRIVAMAFGPGLTVESALLTVHG